MLRNVKLQSYHPSQKKKINLTISSMQPSRWICSLPYNERFSIRMALYCIEIKAVTTIEWSQYAKINVMYTTNLFPWQPTALDKHSSRIMLSAHSLLEFSRVPNWHLPKYPYISYMPIYKTLRVFIIFKPDIDLNFTCSWS